MKSMTGFASLTREEAGVVLGVTIRSVNHRYLDVQLRCPASLTALESRLRALVQRHVARGRVELTLSLTDRRPEAVDVELNEPLLAGLAAALERARERGLVSGALTPGDLLRWPQAFAVREVADLAGGAADLAPLVERTVAEGLGGLDRMRADEGRHLAADLAARQDVLGGLIERIAAAADEGRADLEARLTTRVRELGLEAAGESVLIAQEIVRAAARSDVSEEVVRFRAHLAHWQALVGSDEPCGRKFDFLLQEMHRELNTLGAKAEGARISELVVAAKAELEKIREQVQNVE